MLVCRYVSQAFNDWMRIPPDKEQQITEIVQMLHNASLMYASPVSLYTYSLVYARYTLLLCLCIQY